MDDAESEDEAALAREAAEAQRRGARIIQRARALMAAGKARSWSHAIEIARQTLKGGG